MWMRGTSTGSTETDASCSSTVVLAAGATDADAATEIGGCQLDPAGLHREEVIGMGTTAQVFRGSFRGRAVAIKQVDACSDWGQVFSRELTVLHRVRHPNLVEFIGSVAAQPPLCIVTEFCAGGTLCNLLHCEDVDIEQHQQYKMALDVALALEYLHACKPPIVHRDLKSLNLLLARSITSCKDVPHVKVSDFGLARLKASDTSWGSMTRHVGSCHWMAPEVAAGTTYGEKADVFSYAMILYEIIFREIPFEEEEPEAVVKLFCKGIRPDLLGLGREEQQQQQLCPEGLVRVMCASWQQEAEMRPSFAEIVPCLLLLGQHLGVTAAA